MQTLNKTISLEPLITRYPMCYPSIVDGEVSYYTPEDPESVKNAFYGKIPLGVNEDVCGTYDHFTSDIGGTYTGETMYDKYHEKTLDYYTLQKWMGEFEYYYSLLRSVECRGVPFSSATDYYESTHIDGTYDKDEAKELDTNFILHGGDGFYKWLINNYFIKLDLLGEYSEEFACSYIEWQQYVDNIGRNYMTYPDVVKFAGKMNLWDNMYNTGEPVYLYSEYKNHSYTNLSDSGNEFNISAAGDYIKIETKLIGDSCVLLTGTGQNSPILQVDKTLGQVTIGENQLTPSVFKIPQNIDLDSLITIRISIPNSTSRNVLVEINGVTIGQPRLRSLNFNLIGDTTSNSVQFNLYSIKCSHNGNLIEYTKFGEMTGSYNVTDRYENTQENCSDFETCCDCVDYKNYGGHIMLTLLHDWIERINDNIEHINDTISHMEYEHIERLIPKTQLNFKLDAEIDDLGVYTNFCKEFEPGFTYVSGNVCTYGGDVYVCSAETYNSMEFTTESGWTTYYSSQNHSDDYEYDKVISGRTTSSLELLKRKDLLVDNVGNTLPGHFEQSSNSKFVQPSENTILDFMYVPGTYANIERYTVRETHDENENGQVYICDYLDKIEFYYKDINGVPIGETVAEQGDDVNKKIKECESCVLNGEYPDYATAQNTVENHYIKGSDGSVGDGLSYDYATFDVEGFVEVRFLGLYLSSTSTITFNSGFCFTDEHDQVISAYTWDKGNTSSESNVVTKEYRINVPENAKYFKTEVRFTWDSDQYNIHIKFGQDFYLYKKVDTVSFSGTPDASIMYAKFYTCRSAPVTVDEDMIISSVDTYGSYLKCVDNCTIEKDITYYSLSDDEAYPLKYYKVNMDVERYYSDEMDKEYKVYMCDFEFDISAFTRNYVEFPMLRQEELLPFSQVESPVDNIYIDRGYATALDKHSRISEINSCEQFEKYGNGMFQVIDPQLTKLN